MTANNEPKVHTYIIRALYVLTAVFFVYRVTRIVRNIVMSGDVVTRKVRVTSGMLGLMFKKGESDA